MEVSRVTGPPSHLPWHSKTSKPRLSSDQAVVFAFDVLTLPRRPTTKEQFKRQWKDLSTNARFSMFRAKKKLLRKAEL